MNEVVVSMLYCPTCFREKLELEIFEQEEERIINGVLWCPSCRLWYPIEDELLELLPINLGYLEDRKQFEKKYRRVLSKIQLPSISDLIEMLPADDRLISIKRKQQEHFDDYAVSGKQTYNEYENIPFWQAEDRLFIEFIQKEIEEGKWLLEIGCAQGRSTFKLMDLGINIIAFDISKGTVKQALQRYRSGKYNSKAVFFCADGHKLPFINNLFDYVFVYGVLHHLPDPAVTCQEIARVLKPGGLYLGSENSRSVFRPIFDLLHNIFPLWYEEAGEEPLMSRRDLKKWFEGTGMEIKSRCSVYLFPGMVNWMSPKSAYQVIKWTDAVLTKIPVIKDNGGLIWIRSEKKV